MKLLSKEFDVSINTLLGNFNEEYCKWCYADGEYMYHDMDCLIEVCIPHMTSEEFSFLDDSATYLGNQLECEFGGNRCFGIAANMDFILVSTYEENGENPELVVYKKR